MMSDIERIGRKSSRTPGTLTVRMDAVRIGWEQEFRAVYCLQDYDESLDHLEDALGQGDFRFWLDHLYEMFENAHIPYRHRDNPRNVVAYDRRLVAEYRQQVHSMPGIPQDDQALTHEILLSVYHQLGKYATPTDYMRRIVDRCCNQEDGWQNDPLRLRILKQFLLYGEGLKAAGFQSARIREYAVKRSGSDLKAGKITMRQTVDFIDDGVFTLLEAETGRVRYRDPLGLLKAANDLAAGNFRALGGTRRLLYLFAMVYGMTYGVGDDKDEKDIETNLFQDYYMNNLMRYLSPEFRDNLAEFEKDPSGQGINSKNYAETIYLYYIRKEDLTGLERIRRSTAMIKRLGDAHKKAGHTVDGTTQTYQDYMKQILAMTEEECEHFIGEHYDCDTWSEEVHNTLGEMQVQTGQNSAYRQYEAIMTELILELDAVRDLELSSDYDYAALSREEQTAARIRYLNSYIKENDLFSSGLILPWDNEERSWKKSGEAFYTFLFPEDPKLSAPGRVHSVEQFRQLLLGIDGYMKEVDLLDPDGKRRKSSAGDKEPMIKINKVLNIASAETMTRTAMVAAFYDYYTVFCDYEVTRRKTLLDVFRDFESGLNWRLREAGYLPISNKNIMDLILMISAFLYTRK